MTRKEEQPQSYFPQGTTYIEVSREQFTPVPHQKSDPILNMVLALDSIPLAIADAIRWNHCAPKSRKDLQALRTHLIALQDDILDVISEANEAWQKK